jgi:Fe-Mn family superoxide dismutase
MAANQPQRFRTFPKDRRDAIKTMAMVAAAGVSAVPSFAGVRPSSDGKPFADDVIAKPLPFDAGKLHGISEKLIVSQWENNYVGSVKTLNAVNKKISAALADREFPPFAYNGLKREHLMRTSSVVFYDLYFGNLGGNGKSGGEVEKQKKKAFGDWNSWETEFRRIAQGLSGGSGWIVLGYNFHLKRLENYWAADHMHAPAGAMPLLVMDMYEHSYQIDYGAAAAKYIDAFFQNIAWEAVEKRTAHALSLKWT